MCFKVNGGNELDAVKGLMEMSLNGIMMTVFDLDPDEFKPDDNLIQDLHMSLAQKKELSDLVAEYFNGTTLDFSVVKTAEDLFDCVVNKEFLEVEEFMMC
jgi:hypothetical protein